jgi:ferrous iron transport protein B
VGAVHREAGMRWTLFISLWSTGVGYGSAVLFYQIATISAHPLQTVIWVCIVSVFLILSLLTMQQMGRRDELLPQPMIEVS